VIGLVYLKGFGGELLRGIGKLVLDHILGSGHFGVLRESALAISDESTWRDG